MKHKRGLGIGCVMKDNAECEHCNEDECRRKEMKTEEKMDKHKEVCGYLLIG